MIQAGDKVYEYDLDYETRTNSYYGDTRIGVTFGLPMIILGLALIFLCVADMNDGAYRNSNFFGGRVIAWSENPWWPTYAKGVWVGLMLVVTGFLGIASHYEQTYTAIKVFAYACFIESVFLFYFIMSTIKEIQFGEMTLTSQYFNTLGLYNTYALNSSMAALAVLSIILTFIGGIVSLLMTDFEDYDFDFESYNRVY